MLAWDADSIADTVTIDLEFGKAQGENVPLLISDFENLSVGAFNGGRLTTAVPGWHADLAGDEGANNLPIFLPDAGTAILSGRGGNDDAIRLDGENGGALRLGDFL